MVGELVIVILQRPCKVKRIVFERDIAYSVMDVGLYCMALSFLNQVPFLSLGSRNKIVVVFGGSESFSYCVLTIVMDTVLRFPKTMRTNLRTMSFRGLPLMVHLCVYVDYMNPSFVGLSRE